MAEDSEMLSGYWVVLMGHATGLQAMAQDSETGAGYRVVEGFMIIFGH